mgnify:CR=1 FL=1
MILAVIRIYPRPGLEHSIVEVLESLKGPMAALTGCLGCSVAVETGGHGAVCYLEQWGTREALDQHLRSPLYGRVLEAMECSSLPPVVEFFEVEGVGGLELVEKVRVAH